MTELKKDKELKKAVKLIKHSEKINIFPHIHADGDAIGSAFGIAFILHDLGKKVRVLLEEDPGNKLRFLLDDEIEYKIVEEGDCEKYEADLALVNDCSDRKRVGRRWKIAEKSGAILKIDHHVRTDDFGAANYVNEKWSATCEGVFLLSKALKYEFSKERHGKKAAISLYTGLLTDSGQFGYSNTTPLTHYVASELMKTTGDVSDIARNMFEIKSYGKVKIFARAYENAEKFAQDKGIFTFVTQKDLDETGADNQDTDGISSSLCAVENTEVSAFAKPSESGGWKVSLRSYKTCDVAAVSVKFGGGGHVRAAGFDYPGTLEELKEKLIGELSLGI